MNTYSGVNKIPAFDFLILELFFKQQSEMSMSGEADTDWSGASRAKWINMGLK